MLNRRGRVGRGNRIIIDRVRELKPLYGDQSHEIYRGTLPMAAIRMCPSRIQKEEPPVVELMQGIALPGLERPTSTPFSHYNRMKATSIKRGYEEIMPDHTSSRYYNIDGHLTQLASDMSVHVDTTKRLLLKRNNANEQIEFFL